MDSLTKKSIEARVDIVAEEFDFKKRRYSHPDECPCNGSGPCHVIDDLNCLFCYCPGYETSKIEGGCKLGNPLGTGKWFYRKGNKISDKIWDCSDCIYPHKKEIVKEILTKLFVGELIK
jgi:Zn-finger protein